MPLSPISPARLSAHLLLEHLIVNIDLFFQLMQFNEEVGVLLLELAEFKGTSLFVLVVVIVLRLE